MPSKKQKGSEKAYWVVAEAAFFISLYYVLYLLKIEANLWISSLLLWALINTAILTCPLLKKCR